MQLVLGVDAGGTTSRAALFTLDGTLVRRGHAGGANPGTLGLDTAAANLTTAVRAALPDSGSERLTGAVVGLAGNPSLCATLTERVFGALLSGGDVRGVRVTGDIVTAFAAGTPSPSGTVLISGTGAIAARIADHAPAGTADGYGWLLGDEGSAFWIGLAAARATVRALTAPRSSPTRTGVDPVRDHEPSRTDPALDEMTAGHRPDYHETAGREAGDRGVVSRGTGEAGVGR
ncbi:N-acetylglucosamine kinase, partial [Nonomuraea sp. K271]|nr:hypothetical protein [Nonomuraea sp. K271]